mmetsp:Transcript_20754/g.62516  ORF Transcript_20754/g.62516 Transcript_20754/m.62516 type:complete len:498 (-) Transcript_20754:2103-3596(-)
MGRQSWGAGFQGGRGGSGGGGGGSGAAGRGGNAGWGTGFRSGQNQIQTQNQNQKGWGGGGRGGGVTSGSRFATLADTEDNDRAFDLYRRGGRGGGRTQQALPQHQQQQQQLRQQQQGGHGGGGRGGAPAASWKEVVRSDHGHERPLWPLTCYGHDREGPNDFTGDVCFEELRWQQLQMARSGAQGAQLDQLWRSGTAATEQKWQALLRAQRPPSLGGPPLQAATSSPFVGGAASASPFQQQPTAFQQSGPFQQQPGSVPQQQPGPSQQTQSSGTGGVFGRLGGGTAALAAQPQPSASPFRSQQPAQTFASAFGAASQPTAAGQVPFGPQTAGGFGGGSAGPVGPQAPSPFGAAFGSGATAGLFGGGFGSASAASSAQPGGGASVGGGRGTVFGTGFRAAAGGGGGSAFGAGGSGGSSGFGSVFGTAPSGGGAQTSPQVDVFGAGAPASSAAQQPSADAATCGAAAGAGASDNLSVWTSPQFQKGDIPETPPPPSVCT